MRWKTKTSSAQPKEVFKTPRETTSCGIRLSPGARGACGGLERCAEGHGPGRRLGAGDQSVHHLHGGASHEQSS